MSAPSQQAPTPQSGAGEPDLEFKPVVRYACWGVLACLAVGLSYAAYHLGDETGYNRCYQETVASGKVEASLNSMAVSNVLAVLELEHLPSDQLLARLKQPELSFAWIADAAVKLEAQWKLEITLLNRGYAKETMPFIAKMFTAAPVHELWSRRSAQVAYALQQQGYLSEAAGYYRFASKRFAELGLEHEHLVTCYERLALLTLTQTASQETQDGLFELQQEAEAMGERGASLRTDVLVSLGSVYLRQGDHASALHCFEAALKDKSIAPQTLRPQTCVSYGQAYLEMGNVEKAREFFQHAQKSMGGDPADLQYRLVALRCLATMELDAGHKQEAIALLNQAQGAADGRLSDSDSFWSGLYDQRGWAYFVNDDMEPALADFQACLRAAGTERETLQPLEGAARCLISLGRAQEALPLLRKCCELRQGLAATDPESLASVYYILGVAEASLGQKEEALASYQAAVQRFQAAQPQAKEGLHEALRSVGYTAAELRQWKVASEAWAAVMELCQNESGPLNEAKEQKKKCDAALP